MALIRRHKTPLVVGFMAMFCLSGAFALLTFAKAPMKAYAWSGEGSKEVPFEIHDAADLASLRSLVNSGQTYQNIYFKQTGDIDLLSAAVAPIGTTGETSYSFRGNYDGNGKVIKNLKISVTGVRNTAKGSFAGVAGLFGNSSIGEIKNVTIEGAIIGATGAKGYSHDTATTYNGAAAYAGAIVGVASNGLRVTNCNVTGLSLSATGGEHSGSSLRGGHNGGSAYAGGIVGQGTSITIDNCNASGTVKATGMNGNTGFTNATGGSAYAGAIAGRLVTNSVVANVSSDQSVTLTTVAGSGSGGQKGTASSYGRVGNQQVDKDYVYTITSVSVTYDANGGTYSDSTTSKTQTHTPGSYGSFISPPPTRTGYTLSGWTRDGDTVSTESTVASGEHTLTAQWTLNKLTISYAANGGTGSKSATSHNYNVSVAFPANPFTRTGYTFTGWVVTGTDFTGMNPWTSGARTVSDLTSSITTKSTAITLTAQWVVNKLTITYAANGGTGSKSATAHDYNVSIAFPTNTFTRTGYTFSGWVASGTDFTGTSSWTSGARTVSDLANSITTKDTAIVLTAQWTVNKLTISYAANGGTGSKSATTHDYNTSVAFPENSFTLANHKFTGWAISGADFTGTSSWTNGSRTVSDLTSSITTKSTSITLTAQWTLLCKIDFDGNGGTPSSTPLYVDFNTAYGTLPTATRTGYNFDGWFKSKISANNNQLNDKVSVATSSGAANHTLYARWVAKTPIVSFDKNCTDSSLGALPSMEAAGYGLAYGFLPTPERAGYKFGGWFTSSALANAIGSETGRVVNTTKVTNETNHTLYARWIAVPK